MVADLVERAGGNAFYLEELVRAVVDGKGASLPETVLAMIEVRLESLERSDLRRQVLRAASVFGQVFWSRGDRGVLLGERQALGAPLDGLARRARRPRDRPAPPRGPLPRRARARLPATRSSASGAYAGMLTEDDRAARPPPRRQVARGDRRSRPTSSSLAEHFERGGELREEAIAGYCRAAMLQALEGNDLRGVIARAEARRCLRR